MCLILDNIFIGKRPVASWIAAFLAVAGVYMANDADQANGVAKPSRFILGWLQPVSFGAAFFFLERGMVSLPDHKVVVGSIIITAWQMAMVALMTGLWMWISVDQRANAFSSFSLTDLTYKQTLRELWLGLVTTAGCAVVEAMALQRVQSSEAAVIFTTEPIWAVFFGVVLHHDVLTLHFAVAGLFSVIACGFVAVQSSLQEDSRPPSKNALL